MRMGGKVGSGFGVGWSRKRNVRVRLGVCQRWR